MGLTTSRLGRQRQRHHSRRSHRGRVLRSFWRGSICMLKPLITRQDSTVMPPGGHILSIADSSCQMASCGPRALLQLIEISHAIKPKFCWDRSYHHHSPPKTKGSMLVSALDSLPLVARDWRNAVAIKSVSVVGTTTSRRCCRFSTGK